VKRFARSLLAALALTAATAHASTTPSAPAREPATSATVATAATATTDARVHGVWVWKTRELLRDGTSLSDACRSAGANEVYLAVTHGLLSDPRLPKLVAQLQADGLRVEALMGDPAWSRPDEWHAMRALIDDVVAYNRRNAARFVAIHLDVEPHALRANRGADVSSYLPVYVESLQVARKRAEAGGLSLSADVPRFFFTGNESDRRELVSAVPRLFLMLYELPGHAGPSDVASSELARASVSALRAAYEEVDPDAKGQMVVGLSVEDYGSQLQPMLAAVDVANSSSTRYGGWAIHDFSQYVASRAAQN
jgi:hypothetical protein